ncbi:MAG TPA: DUF1800 domain-containing protein [Allosphingosinicella sp.]|jgi:uncharacterized protein (DUF1800 family)|nr:DUF1800 domain-containing protein [Allosphingosinicella sp.]
MNAQTIALSRFGLGARPDEALPADPKAWLHAQLGGFDPRPAAIAAAPTRQEVATQLAEYFEELRTMGGKAARQAPASVLARPQPASMTTMPGQPMMDQSVAGQPKSPQAADVTQTVQQFIRKASRDYYLTSVAARTDAALTTPAPFVERLVHFWANHFAVSADKLQVIGLVGLLEFEAIRPHVLGKFEDMLVAVEQHPAMLLYLDQAQSVGPDSRLGAIAASRGRKVGLNENLGREIMELHTLGVRSGYTQADVTEFARALTGWTVDGIGRGPAARAMGGGGAPGAFHFAEAIHQPGARTILGKKYDQPGVEQARAVLHDLATSPATARHIATKLARHFAADDPPPALVDRLSTAFLKSGGDLPAVYRVLIDAPEVWNPANTKFRTPWDWSVAALRAVGSKQLQGQAIVGLMNQLGQPVWKPGSPAGYDDIAASWAGPDALVRRVEAADRIASRAAGLVDPRQIATKVLPDMSQATSLALARAESPGQGLALLLASPEFLRR